MVILETPVLLHILLRDFQIFCNIFCIFIPPTVLLIDDLIIILNLGLLLDKVITVDTRLILRVLNGNLGKMGKDVLHVGVGAVALGTSKVVEPRPVVHQVVNNGSDDGDTNGETPDNNNSDNAGVTVLGEKGVLGNWVRWLTSTAAQPTEDTEEGSNDINTEDGTNQLP